MVKEFVKGKKYKTSLGYIVEFVEYMPEENKHVAWFKELSPTPYIKSKGLIGFLPIAYYGFKELPDEAV